VEPVLSLGWLYGTETRDDKLNILKLRIVWKPDTVNVEGLESDVATDAEGLQIDCKVLSDLSAGHSTT
jgi:hypothetical protein